MKPNFWQILGIVLLVIALVLLFRKHTATNDVINAPATAATTR